MFLNLKMCVKAKIKGFKNWKNLVCFEKMNYTTWVHTTSYKGLRYVKFVLNTKLMNVNYKLISTFMKYFESMFNVQSTCIMPKCVFHD
jgi:hypothetical protein